MALWFGTSDSSAETRRKLRFLSGVSLGVLALGYSVEPSIAATFTVSNQAELYQAIADAQASADASSTITLSGSFTLTSAFPAVASKNITVDTNGNTLTFSVASGFNVAAGATLTFSGNVANVATNLAKTGSGTLYLESTGSGITSIALNGGETIVDGGQAITFTSNSATLAQLGIAVNAGQVAKLTISGAGTVLQATGTGNTDLAFANGSIATLTIEGGGSYVTAGGIRLFTPAAGGTATVNVLGAGSSLNAVAFGSFNGTTYINVLDGGVVNLSQSTNFGGLASSAYAKANVTAIVSGAGSRWDTAAQLNMYRGSLSVLDGGVVTGATVNVATSSSTTVIPNFSVLVSGNGSELRGTTMNVGTTGTGVLTIADDGKVVVNGGASALVLGGVSANSNASLNIGGAVGAAATAAGTLQASAVTLAASAEINFNHTETGYVFDTPINGSGAINQYAGHTIFNADQTGFTGITSVYGGILDVNGILTGTSDVYGGLMEVNGTLSGSADVYGGVLAVNGTMSGAANIYGGLMQVAGTLSSTADIYGGMLEVTGLTTGDVGVHGGILSGTGTTGATTNYDGGTIAPGIGGIGTLTIGGNYTSNGGTLQIESVLYDDASPTDLLVITGDTILGTAATKIFVTNLSGYGGETTGDGIKIVDVAGISAADVFVLGAPAIGGAYRYGLFQNGITDPTDGDWYLRTVSLAPTVPVYESYPVVLLGMTELPTLRQRVGDRYWTEEDEGAGAGHGYTGPRNFWTRIEGAHGHNEGSSTTGMSYDSNRYLVQVGLDGLLGESDRGLLIGGLNLQYGQTHANVVSPIGSGDNDTDSYSIGATLSWYGSDGFYVDGQASIARLSTDLSADEVGRLVDRNDGNGYALSIEAGRRMPVDGNWSIIPQAQFSYNSVKFDSFTDPFNAHVSLDNADNAKGRIGVAVDYDEGAGAGRNHVYAIANLTYDFRNGTSVNVSDVNVKFEPEKLGAEVGIGGTYRWAEGKYNLYGEAVTSTRFDGSYGLKGTVGFSTAF